MKKERIINSNFKEFISTNENDETAYLMSSAKNVERIDQAIEQLEQGKGIRRDLIEE